MWEKVAFLNILWFEYKSTVLKCQVSALKIQFSSKNQLFYFIRYFKNSIYSKFWRSLKVNPTQNASLDIEVCATFYSNSRATAWGLVILKKNSKILILYYELQKKKKKILEIFWGNFFSVKSIFLHSDRLFDVCIDKKNWFGTISDPIKT